MSLRLMPARGTKVTGRLDQFARCFWSSNGNSTLCRCLSSKVERKVFAALTIPEAAVPAAVAVTHEQIRANAPMAPMIRLEQRFMSCSPVQPPYRGCSYAYFSGFYNCVADFVEKSWTNARLLDVWTYVRNCFPQKQHWYSIAIRVGDFI
jgi:hypothetical protein